jgi:hypothetical protein
MLLTWGWEKRDTKSLIRRFLLYYCERNYDHINVIQNVTLPPKQTHYVQIKKAKKQNTFIREVYTGKRKTRRAPLDLWDQNMLKNYQIIR